MDRAWIGLLLMLGGCGGADAVAPPAPVCAALEDRLSSLERSIGAFAPRAIEQRVDTAEARLSRVEKVAAALEQDRPLHLYSVSIHPPGRTDLGRYAGGTMAYDADREAVIDHAHPVELLFETDDCRGPGYYPADEAGVSRMGIGPRGTLLRPQGPERTETVRSQLRFADGAFSCASLNGPSKAQVFWYHDTADPMNVLPRMALVVGP